MVTRATLSGKIQSGKTPVVEYKRQADAAWSTLATSAVKVSGTSFTASLTGLKAATAYQYRVSVDGTAGEEQSFTTAEAVPLTNGSFDDWSSVPRARIRFGNLGRREEPPSGIRETKGLPPWVAATPRLLPERPGSGKHHGRYISKVCCRQHLYGYLRADGRDERCVAIRPSLHELPLEVADPL